MKKTFVLFAAFVACIALSCSKIGEPAKEEVIDPVTGMKTVTFTATIDGYTKTAYADGSGDFSWTAGDQISVLGNDDNYYTFTASSTAATTTFTGTLPGGVELGSFALFPADAGHTTTKFSVPKTKDTRATGSADLPMYGKNTGSVFTFTHMTGGIRLTIDNFPSSITYATVSVVNASLKLSGLFTINESVDHYHVWSAAGGSTVDEKSFIRTVPVVDNKAVVFIPYAVGGDMWAASTLNVTGYNSSDVPTDFVTDKNIKGNGTAHVRAKIIPYQPLMIYNAPDFSLPGVVTTSCGASHTEVSEMKSYADKGYVHLQFHGTTASWTGNSMTLYIYDGGTDNVAPYTAWNQKEVTNELHTSVSISTSELSSVKLGGKSCTTSVTSSGDQTYWTISIPRTASSAMMGSAGSVYVGFFIQDSANGWATTAAIPEVYDSRDMVTVTLP